MAKGKFFGLEILDLDNFLRVREDVIKLKSGAVTSHFDELNSIINITKFAKRYFGKSQSWFSQRLHGSLVMKREQAFKEEEYAIIAEGYRDLAKQLLQYADELDKAEMD